MSKRHLQFVERLRQAVLGSPGAMGPGVREAVEGRAAGLGGRSGAGTDAIPAELRPFVEKVAERAYAVTDGDVEALRRAGYSEDAIFEVTTSAALGAGLARLERGLAALKGDV